MNTESHAALIAKAAPPLLPRCASSQLQPSLTSRGQEMNDPQTLFNILVALATAAGGVWVAVLLGVLK
jgi:hypothetical protein